MNFSFEQRPSDAPFVDGVWRTTSQEGGSFMSVAGTQLQMVIMKQSDGARAGDKSVDGPLS